MKSILPFLALFLFLYLRGSCQEVQWASDVVFQFNNFGEDEWSGKQVTGPPDAKPLGQINPRAFRLQQKEAYGKITLSYEQPQQVGQILIVENYLPGRISKVTLIDDRHREYSIYEPTVRILNIPYRILSITIDKTPYRVSSVSVHVNTYYHSGWSQIDAVGIAETPVGADYIAKLESKPNYIFQEDLTFMGKKEKLNPNINSEYEETKPLFSPDGKYMYFVRQNHPENIGGIRDDQDIYSSMLLHGQWTIARNMGAPLNDIYSNGICSISPDGNTLYLLNSYSEEGMVNDGFSVSRRNGQNWTIPIKQTIDNFYTRSTFQDYFVSQDGTVLIMAIDRDDSFGDQDLYVSFKVQDNHWSKPRNLGKRINSPHAEFSPFLASDNHTLFYASNGHNGGGDSDIFYTKRLDDTWANWTAPENLGPEVNTPGWDGYFSLTANSEYAVFVSNHDPDGSNRLASSRDIYRIRLDIEPTEGERIIVHGNVVDHRNGQPVSARVTYRDAENPDLLKYKITDPGEGSYKIALNPQHPWVATVEADGFLSINQPINLRGMQEPEYRQDFQLIPLAVGQVFQLEDLHFVQGKPDLLPESKPQLDRLLQILQENPSLKIQLSGHTDRLGTQPVLKKLSQQRADAVREYLINNGIAKNRLRTEGYGGSVPIASNETPEERRLNRRVEVKILNF
jgi:outer membrane protein OmpA-like peptidoglycan-associated protein